MSSESPATHTRPRFHLAFPVRDIEEARAFYGGVLGCSEGRSAADWVDFDFHGHQIVAHRAPAEGQLASNLVDGHPSPVRHFGVILDIASWESVVAKLKSADVTFVSQPEVRFSGLPGEQRTVFVSDPSGNVIEFKAFARDDQVFAR